MFAALALTGIGAGIGAYGQYQAGMAKGAQATSLASEYSQLAGAERQAADVTEYAGFRGAEAAGLRAGAGVGRQAVEFGAGNIAGAAPVRVRASQLALGQLGERETLAKYQETAYQERLRGAEYATGAQREAIAAGEARREGTIGAIGSLVSAGGSVAGKWYQASQVTPSSSPYTGASDEAIY